MAMRLRVLTLLFALPTVVGTSPAIAQSGVLIGLSSGRTSSAPEAPFAGYETLWVSRNANGFYTRTIPDLLIPRRSGWWRVGVAVGCAGQSGEESSITEILWMRSASDTLHLLAPEHCADSTEPRPDSAAEAAYPSYGARDCVTHLYEITFVGPSHVAFRNRSGQTEICEPRGGRWTSNAYVRHLGSDSSASMTELLGPAGPQLVMSAFRSSEESKHCESPYAEDLQAELFITRRAGRWRPVAFLRGWMMSCEVEQEVRATLLRSVTGPDVVSPSWAEIRRAHPAATDAFSSPSRDLVFVRVGDSLQIHAVSNGKVGPRTGAVNVGVRDVLMIQWATGSHVARWDAEIAAMLSRGLRAPHVIPAPPSSQ
jgi:hypothetical protein